MVGWKEKVILEPVHTVGEREEEGKFRPQGPILAPGLRSGDTGHYLFLH